MKKWNELSMSERAEAIKVAVKHGITDLRSVRDKWHEFAEGGNKETPRPVTTGGGGNLFGGESQDSQQLVLGKKYWQQQEAQPQRDYLAEMVEYNKKKEAERQQRVVALRRELAAKGEQIAKKGQKEYLTMSNDNTWIERNNGREKNPHLADRAVKGAKAHAAWEEENPNLAAWSKVLGAAPLAVAAYPLAATAGSGVVALGDAAAATSVGQGVSNFLAPLASSTIEGIPALEWANLGLTSSFAAHGIQTAINEGGISPMTALEIAPLGRLVKPMVNESALAIENYRYPLGRPQVPKNFLTIKPQVRTKVGDVEIDSPNLLYHLDRGDGAGAFSTQGAYIEDGFLFPGTPKDASATPYSWWNKGKPYATAVQGQPMTRLMTTTEDTPGMLHVRSQNYPIGQWNGKKGFVLPSEYVNPEGVNVSGSTYTLDPNYGWRKVLADDIPTIEWAEAVKTP